MTTEKPEPQSDDCFVICPYCNAKYQAEDSDSDETEREEVCENCGKTYIVWEYIEVTHHTKPIEIDYEDQR